jgi:hypothetical protein
MTKYLEAGVQQALILHYWQNIHGLAGCPQSVQQNDVEEGKENPNY